MIYLCGFIEFIKKNHYINGTLFDDLFLLNETRVERKMSLHIEKMDWRGEKIHTILFEKGTQMSKTCHKTQQV